MEIIDLLSSDDDQGCVRVPQASTHLSTALTNNSRHSAISPVNTNRSSKEAAKFAQFQKKRKQNPLASNKNGNRALPPTEPVQTCVPRKPLSIEQFGNLGDLMQGKDSTENRRKLSAILRRRPAAIWQSWQDEDSDTLPEEPLILEGEPRPSQNGLSNTTASLLAGLSQTRKSQSKGLTTKRKSSQEHGVKVWESSQCSLSRDTQTGPETETGIAPAKKPRVRKDPIVGAQEKAARAKEREDAKVARDAERAQAKLLKASTKEEEAERRRKLKEQKAQERKEEATLVSLNKFKDKKDCSSEMIVDLPSSIAGSALDTQTRERLETLDIEASIYESEIPNLVKWRRKVLSQWHNERNRWEPLPRMRIDRERHVIPLMPAKEFVARTLGEQECIDILILNIRKSQPGCIPIILIEGLRGWMRKNKNAHNRAYVESVRASEDPSQVSQSRPKKATPKIIDSEAIEDALLDLQIKQDCLIHHTKDAVDTAHWIGVFTQQISQAPYKTQAMNLSQTTFCMDGGQMCKGGRNATSQDIYLGMLQEVVRVTQPVAEGIAANYPDVASLARAFQKEGPRMLEDIMQYSYRTGQASTRRIGPSISRRMYNVFTGTDPGMTDI